MNIQQGHTSVSNRKVKYVINHMTLDYLTLATSLLIYQLMGYVNMTTHCVHVNWESVFSCFNHWIKSLIKKKEKKKKNNNYERILVP